MVWGPDLLSQSSRHKSEIGPSMIRRNGAIAFEIRKSQKALIRCLFLYPITARRDTSLKWDELLARKMITGLSVQENYDF